MNIGGQCPPDGEYTVNQMQLQKFWLFKKFWLFNLVLPIGFFLIAVWGMPITTVFQFDPNDEGIELIKAISHSAGFELYTQIYNDQPPLFTILLAGWLRILGHGIVTARLLTLSFATVLVWSFAQTLRFYLGDLAAIVGAGFLIISCNFLRLSVSVMVGLPSLALAMLAIYALTLYKQYRQHQNRHKHKQITRSRLALAASGTLLALSLQIKLFTALLLPLMLVDLIIFHRVSAPLMPGPYLSPPPRSTDWRIWVDGLIWLIALTTVFIGVGVSCHSLSYTQLVHSHFDQTVKTAFAAADSYKVIAGFLGQDFDYGLLAIPAILTIWQAKRWLHWFPIAWLIAAFLLLLQHRPVWYHHYLLISLPLTWLATQGAMLGVEQLRQRPWFQRGLWESGTTIRTKVATIGVIGSLLLIPVKIAVTHLENQRVLAQSPLRVELVQALRRDDRRSMPWLFTDCPMYAFYANLPVPPEIAVLSLIRIDANTITKAQFLEVLAKYQPEQVLLCKSLTLRHHVQDYLDRHYALVYENPIGRVYRLK
jgi:Dolichyl-phosphate-mannose-protein mannosyltransferase